MDEAHVGGVLRADRHRLRHRRGRSGGADVPSQGSRSRIRGDRCSEEGRVHGRRRGREGEGRAVPSRPSGEEHEIVRGRGGEVGPGGDRRGGGIRGRGGRRRRRRRRGATSGAGAVHGSSDPPSIRCRRSGQTRAVGAIRRPKGRYGALPSRIGTVGANVSGRGRHSRRRVRSPYGDVLLGIDGRRRWSRGVWRRSDRGGRRRAGKGGIGRGRRVGWRCRSSSPLQRRSHGSPPPRPGSQRTRPPFHGARPMAASRPVLFGVRLAHRPRRRGDRAEMFRMRSGIVAPTGSEHDRRNIEPRRHQGIAGTIQEARSADAYGAGGIRGGGGDVRTRRGEGGVRGDGRARGRRFGVVRRISAVAVPSERHDRVHGPCRRSAGAQHRYERTRRGGVVRSGAGPEGGRGTGALDASGCGGEGSEGRPEPRIVDSAPRSHREDAHRGVVGAAVTIYYII
mmetsp:Transcript_29608/g.87778  ORF Transcript_29608/g.87778 Transcript_29608/m.87778 type:complete len:452 (-) Transcript_29608:40-1395(-)